MQDKHEGDTLKIRWKCAIVAATILLFSNRGDWKLKNFVIVKNSLKCKYNQDGNTVIGWPSRWGGIKHLLGFQFN